jgi:hypothetical protein
MTRPIPFRPDRTAVRDSTARSFIRACTAELLARNTRHVVPADRILARHWPDDSTAGMVLKSASSPASVGSSSWAGVLAGGAPNATFISTLGPSSAAAALLNRGLSLEWPPGVGTLRVPGIITSPTGTFLGEGQPIGVYDRTTSALTLTPKKLPVLTVFSRELFEYSIPNVEALVRVALGESVALAIDTVLFGAGAGDTVHPPGLLTGSPLTASSQSFLVDAMIEDISAVCSAVSAVSGTDSIVLVMAPAQAEAARLRLNTSRLILASHALSAGTIVAVGTNTLASAIDPAPTFTSSIEATYHMDSAPAAIGTPGTPNVVAATTVSSFQSDLIGLRLVLRASWGLRHPSGVSWISGVKW